MFKKLLKTFKFLKNTEFDPDRKPIFKIIFEYTYFRISRPTLAEQYFHKRLFRKSVNNPSDFILTQKIVKRIWGLNDLNYFSLVIKKDIAEKYFTMHDIPIVRSIANNINTLFFTDGNLKQINSLNEFKDFLLDLKESGLWTSDAIFIKKRELSYGGKDIFKLSLKEVTENEKKLKEVFGSVLSSGYLFQNTLEQHSDLNRLNPKSVNTLRIDTYTDKAGVCKIFCVRLKTSQGNTFVDNMSSGGIFTGVNIETGIIETDGFVDFNQNVPRVFTEHPLTKTQFKGFEIPHFEEATAIAQKAALVVPGAKVMGWDIAILPEGPIIIEGNFFNELNNSELVMNGYKNNPVVNELIEEALLNKPAYDERTFSWARI